MRITRSWLLPVAAGASALAVALSGCANKPVIPQPGEYGFVIGGGSSSNQNLHYIVDPGVHIKVSNGDRVLYIPAGVRDFVTAKPGTQGADRTNPDPSYTAGGSDGVKPIQVRTYDHVVMELNPNKSVLHKFYDNLCVKYGCGSLNPDTTNQNATLELSSSPGWRHMILDKFSTAVDNATRAASAQFGPDLWHNTGRWADYAAAIAKALPAELRVVMGAGTDNYFCGANSTPTDCTPFAVLIKDVVPTDSAITAQYSQQNEADLQNQIAQRRQEVAKKLYGDEWPYWTGVLQLVQQCKQSGGSCPTIVIGQPNAIPTAKG